MIEIKKETERVILVGVSLSETDDTKESLEELKDLVSTAGAETVGMVIQKREQQHPGRRTSFIVHLLLPVKR